MESKKNKNTEKKDENIVEAKVIVEEPKKAYKKLVGVGVAVAVVTAIVTTVGLAGISAFVGCDDDDEDEDVSDVFKDEEDEKAF